MASQLLENTFNDKVNYCLSVGLNPESSLEDQVAFYCLQYLQSHQEELGKLFSLSTQETIGQASATDQQYYFQSPETFHFESIFPEDLQDFICGDPAVYLAINGNDDIHDRSRSPQTKYKLKQLQISQYFDHTGGQTLHEISNQYGTFGGPSLAQIQKQDDHLFDLLNQNLATLEEELSLCSILDILPAPSTIVPPTDIKRYPWNGDDENYWASAYITDEECAERALSTLARVLPDRNVSTGRYGRNLGPFFNNTNLKHTCSYCGGKFNLGRFKFTLDFLAHVFLSSACEDCYLLSVVDGSRQTFQAMLFSWQIFVRTIRKYKDVSLYEQNLLVLSEDLFGPYLELIFGFNPDEKDHYQSSYYKHLSLTYLVYGVPVTIECYDQFKNLGPCAENFLMKKCDRFQYVENEPTRFMAPSYVMSTFSDFQLRALRLCFKIRILEAMKRNTSSDITFSKDPLESVDIERGIFTSIWDIHRQDTVETHGASGKLVSCGSLTLSYHRGAPALLRVRYLRNK